MMESAELRTLSDHSVQGLSQKRDQTFLRKLFISKLTIGVMVERCTKKVIPNRKSLGPTGFFYRIYPPHLSCQSSFLRGALLVSLQKANCCSPFESRLGDTFLLAPSYRSPEEIIFLASLVSWKFLEMECWPFGVYGKGTTIMYPKYGRKESSTMESQYKSSKY